MRRRRRAGSLPYIVDDGETDRRQRDHHRPRHRQIPPDDRRCADRGAARHRSPDHAHARRSLLGDVVFALEGRALLAGVPRRADAGASEPDRSRPAARRASSISSAITSRASAATRPRPLTRAASPIWRCWRISFPRSGYVHGPTPTSIDAGIYGFIANIFFFDIDDATEAIRRRARQSRAPLPRHPRCRHGEVSYLPATLRSAALMRSCQPGPSSWKKSSTSRSMRSDTISLTPGGEAALSAALFHGLGGRRLEGLLCRGARIVGRASIHAAIIADAARIVDGKIRGRPHRPRIPGFTIPGLTLGAEPRNRLRRIGGVVDGAERHRPDKVRGERDTAECRFRRRALR